MSIKYLAGIAVLAALNITGCKEEVVVGSIHPGTECRMSTQDTQNACELKEGREASQKRMKKRATIGKF